ncbi:unnamed protein product [Gongylonema pulchrum]|uniref:Uncharacterized protein n=1 Tax=Gongylonema pulchrum TaxID=637853 RepID=A0A183EF80_9BILA|nr:unnamed protein product [Gongylonema pulchrum]
MKHGPNGSERAAGALMTEPVAVASTSSGAVDLPENDEPSTVAASLPSVSCMASRTSDVICNPWRNLVSQNRRRYKKDSFDLDLTF